MSPTQHPPFDLLETLALCEGQWRHRAAHLARMAESARCFGRDWPEARLHAALDEVAQQHPEGLWRGRLLLTAQGEVLAEAHPLADTPQPVRLCLAPQPLAEAHGLFVRHKTTHRAHYDALAPTEAGVFDTVLWNPAGELTECTRGNLAVCIDGRWVTPPLACGLLPGVGRQQALVQGRVQEAVVHLDDLPRVQAWAFVNSLRGWLSAVLQA